MTLNSWAKCWRDFLAMSRTTDSNKTQYSQMAVVRVYWGNALNEPLQSVHHRICSLKLTSSHVGWDMFIERVNLSIRHAAVKHDITREYPSKFLSFPSFTDIVDRSIGELLYRKNEGHRTLKDISAINASNANWLGFALVGGGRNSMQRNEMPLEKVKRKNTGEQDYRALRLIAPEKRLNYKSKCKPFVPFVQCEGNLSPQKDLVLVNLLQGTYGNFPPIGAAAGSLPTSAYGGGAAQGKRGVRRAG
eukprot:2888249-Pleurochrysis_carterae.AAC.6